MTPSGFGDLFKRIFGPGESEEVDVPERGREEPPKNEHPGEQPGEQPGKIASAAKKVALLRQTLEFEEDLAGKVGEIHTARNMLLFMHQHVLLRFEQLRELGMVSEKSYSILGSISAKSQELLVAAPVSGHEDPAALAQENESLRRQLKALYAKHVKSDIISEKELTLEEDKAKLKGRLDDLKQRYDGAQKKIEGFQNEIAELKKTESKYKLLYAKSAAADRGAEAVEKSSTLLRDLESQNKLLKGKLEHQDRLIKAMSWGDVKNKELFDTIAELGEEKKMLKRQVKAGDTLEKILDFPMEGEAQAGFGELLKENRSLYEKLETTDAVLEEGETARDDKSPFSSMEGLQEDTFILKELIEAKKAIEAQLDEKNKRIKDANAMMEHIRRENMLLKQALEAKAKKTEGIDDDPIKKNMMATIGNLRKDNARVHLEMENLHYVISTVSARNEAIEGKLRQLIAMGRENKQLKQEAERKDNLLADYEKKEDELKNVKKLCYQIQSEYTKVKAEHDKAVEENVRLEEKIKRVRSEYEGMISEYNKLFDEN